MAHNGAEIVNQARTWLGTPWREGGTAKGPAGGVDCSNLVNLSYAAAGYTYPYAATSQFPPDGYFSIVGATDVEEGDVVLFAGHMGILAEDDGKDIISAQGSHNKPGIVQVGQIAWFGPVKGYYRWAR